MTPESVVTTIISLGANSEGKSGLIGPFLTGATLTTAIGWIATRIYEQFSNRLTQRREFIKETTKRVVDLSWQHYWGLANAAGTLGALLHAYLRLVEAHLFVSYVDPGETPVVGPERLRERLSQVAKEAADSSFPSFARLVMRFHNFQFQGSNTYLLPHHESGEALRRLYNQLVACLPKDIPSDIRRGVESYEKNLKGVDKNSAQVEPDGSSDASDSQSAKADSQPSTPQRDVNDAFLEDPDMLSKLPELNASMVKWRAWLEQALPQVSEAADSATAYADLMAHELALLNSTFFRDRVQTSLPPGHLEWAHRRWPDLLTEGTLQVVARAGAYSRWFSPLGGIGRTWKVPQKPSEDASKKSTTGNRDPEPTTGKHI